MIYDGYPIPKTLLSEIFTIEMEPLKQRKNFVLKMAYQSLITVEY